MSKETTVSTWEDFKEIKASLQEALELLKDENSSSIDVSEEFNLLSQKSADVLSPESPEKEDEYLSEPTQPETLDVTSEQVEETAINEEAPGEGITGLKNETTEESRPDKPENIQDQPDAVPAEPAAKPPVTELLENSLAETEISEPALPEGDKSEEESAIILDTAQEPENSQVEEPVKQDKKKFGFGFKRDKADKNQKPGKEKEPKKQTREVHQLKPMVYEIPKVEQVKDFAEKPEPAAADIKSTPVTKSSPVKDMHNLRKILELSKHLGVPVFLKHPVNVEQIRKLKLNLMDYDDLKIMVDTGSIQGHALVIAGQEPGDLLNTLSELSVVESATGDDEKIDLTLKTTDVA